MHAERKENERLPKLRAITTLKGAITCNIKKCIENLATVATTTTATTTTTTTHTLSFF